MCCRSCFLTSSIHAKFLLSNASALAWMRFCSFQVVMPCLTNTRVFSCSSSWLIRDRGPGLELDRSVAPVLYRLLGASEMLPFPLRSTSSVVPTCCALQASGSLHRQIGALAAVKAGCGGLTCRATPA